MNFLQIVQRLRKKCRVGGTGPAAVTGQNAEYTRLIDAVNEAWMAIQNKHTDWLFMRASASCTTLQGTYAYYAVTHFGLSDFGYWALNYEDGETFRCNTTAVGQGDEQRLGVVQYDDWRDTYLLNSNRTSYQRPGVVAVGPDSALIVGPIPAAGYTLAGDYYKVPTEMVNDVDTPSLPVQHHMAIIYRAMMFFGAAEAAPEVYDEGLLNYGRMIREIERTQLRQVLGAPPLA